MTKLEKTFTDLIYSIKIKMVNNKKSTKLVKQHELYKYGELVLVIHNDVITPGRIHQLFSVTVRARATVRKLTEETLMTSQTEEKQQFMYHIYVYGLAESKLDFLYFNLLF